MSGDAPPEFVLHALAELRRRQFGVGVADLMTLRTALRAGFGWGSDRELVELCVTLWATTAAEAETVRAVFARHGAPDWDLAAASGPAAPAPAPDAAGRPPAESPIPAPQPVLAPPAPIGGAAALPPLPALTDGGRKMIFDPQYPLSRRVLAQAFRRLRRPIPYGPPTQLDLAATVARRSRSGVATAAVLVPRRRNSARLLLMIDRQGSMTPFHPYTDHMRDAIDQDGGLAGVEVAYFHDAPPAHVERRLVRRLSRVQPQLDPVLAAVRPSLHGVAFTDPGLLEPRPLAEVVDGTDVHTAVVVISDAGAARGSVDPVRNLAAVAFTRALHERRQRVVWLNPMPAACWTGSSAAQLARHVPMFALDRTGLHQAIDVLRGSPVTLDRAV